MPPNEYNPNNAGKFEAIKVPEQPNGPEKKGPNFEKLAELKRIAAEKKLALQQKESALKAAEAPQIDAALHTSRELAVSGTPDKSFSDLSPAEKSELAKRILAANAERLEGNQAVARGDTSPVPVERPKLEQNAGMYPALTPEQIRKAQEEQMVVDSPMTAAEDAKRMNQARTETSSAKAQPQAKKPWYQFW